MKIYAYLIVFCIVITNIISILFLINILGFCISVFIFLIKYSKYHNPRLNNSLIISNLFASNFILKLLYFLAIFSNFFNTNPILWDQDKTGNRVSVFFDEIKLLRILLQLLLITITIIYDLIIIF
jgi:hypothetical protein